MVGCLCVREDVGEEGRERDIWEDYRKVNRLGLKYCQSLSFKFEMHRDRRVDQQNLSRTMKGSKIQEQLSDLLAEKRKLKKKNLVLQNQRDRIQSDIQRTISRTHDTLQHKKSLLLSLQSARHDKSTPAGRLAQQQRCHQLQSQTHTLQLQLQQLRLRVQNIQQQYSLNVKRYDQVILKVGQLSQLLAQSQTSVVAQIANLKALKSVNFDSEKLRRLLEEEKNIAIKTQLHENRSYEERQREYQEIKGKLEGDERRAVEEAKKRRKKAAGLLLGTFLKGKVLGYYRRFMTFRIYTLEGDKSVKCMLNLCKIGEAAGKYNLRNFWSKWHRIAMQPTKLISINQTLLTAKTNLKTRIKTMSKWNQQFNRSQLSILNDYQKGKMLTTLRMQLSRKQLSTAFSHWRSLNTSLNTLSHTLSRLSTISNRFSKRIYFRYWKTQKDNFNRFIQSSTIHSEFTRLKELSRGMRRWRYGMARQDLTRTEALIRKTQMRELVNMRVRYLKRKTKLLTILMMRGVRTEMRAGFYRYWGNVFGRRVGKERREVEQEEHKKGELKLQLKVKMQQYTGFRKGILTRAMYKFMFKKKGLAFMDWYNKMIGLRKRDWMVYTLMKKKDTMEKLNAMNRFRKNQKDFQKKEMHAVLTDLNKKMESINEKSTEYREKLQKSISELGLLGAKKLESLIQRNAFSTSKNFFQKFKRKSISHDYESGIKKNVFELAHYFMLREAFMKICGKARKKKYSLYLRGLQMKFISLHNRHQTMRCFRQWKRIHESYKKACIILQNFETLYFFYRTVLGFKFIKQKVDFIKAKELALEYKNLAKNLQTRLAILDKDSKQQSSLQTSLKQLYIRFIRFQNLSQTIKKSHRNTTRLSNSLTLWRKWNSRQTHTTNQLSLFLRLLDRKNLRIFIQKAMTQKFINTSYDIKDQMAKLAKKKKTFEEKSVKSRQDISRRLEEEEKVYNRIKGKMEKRIGKYEKFLEVTEKRNTGRVRMQYMRGIWVVWKEEYMAVRRMGEAVDRNQVRNKLAKGFNQIKAYIKLMDDTYVRQSIVGKLLQKKNRDLKLQGLRMMRYNIRATTLHKIQSQIQKAKQLSIASKSTYISYAPLVAKAKATLRTYLILQKAYLKFKNYSSKKKLKKKKVLEMRLKIAKRITKQVFDAMAWRRYFKQTSREYVQWKKNRFEDGLMRDVFQVWRTRRMETRWAVQRIVGSFVKDCQRRMVGGFMKIRNYGLDQRDILNEKRRKALRHLLKKRQGDQLLTKQTYLYRWHFHLHPRHHYLCHLLSTLSRQALLSPFYRLRQHAYWHADYINRHAQKQMQQNKTDTKASMNLLIEENIDPEEIKAYMKQKNAKDTTTMRRVVCRLRNFGEKGMMVRGWHSWREFLLLKKNIKRAMTKMFTICDGKGKYWNRWRGKDQKFLHALEKESRGSMLNRYHQLQHLLKQYRKDVKINIQRTYQLATVNQQYQDSLSNSKFIALRSMSAFVKKGLSKAVHLWRRKMLDLKKTDQNEKFSSLGKYIEDLLSRKEEMMKRVTEIQMQNMQLRESCLEGGNYAHMLKELLYEKEKLSICLADKKHNMKVLLQDNLKIKQKLRNAQEQAIKLISQFEPILRQEPQEEM